MADALISFVLKQLDDFLDPTNVTNFSYTDKAAAPKVLDIVSKRVNARKKAAGPGRNRLQQHIDAFQTVLRGANFGDIAIDLGIDSNEVRRILTVVQLAVNFFLGQNGHGSLTGQPPNVLSILDPLLTTTAYLGATLWPQSVEHRANALRDAINVVSRNSKALGPDIVLVPRKDLDTIQHGAALLAETLTKMYSNWTDMAKSVYATQTGIGPVRNGGSATNEMLKAPVTPFASRAAPRVCPVLCCALATS